MLGLSVETINRVANQTYIAAGAVAIVATAVALLASFFMWRTSDAIADIKDQAFADYKVASGAEMARANEGAALANERAAKLEAGAAQADKAVAEANQKTAQLRLDLERERLERVKLQASVSSRHITPEQRDTLRETIKNSFGIFPLLIVTRIGDQEANIYANEIIQALNGLVAIRIFDVGVMAPPPYGVNISGQGTANIAAAFDAAGIPVTQDASTGNGSAQMVIGLKPSN